MACPCRVGWNGAVNSFHQVQDRLGPLCVTLESLEAGYANNRSVVAIEALAGEEFTNLELNELKDFFVVNHVGLVQSNEEVRNTNLLCEQNVLASLSHRTVSSSNHEDCAIHLSSTGNHVLDVVGVARCVNVCVVTLGGLVLNVRDVDGNTALTLFRSGVDRREVALNVGCGWVGVSENLGDRCGKSGLTVVNVSDGTDVYVRLVALEFGLSHGVLLGHSSSFRLETTGFGLFY
jgi:hypothetical protein